MNVPAAKHYCRAFSLVELMVAMVLGLLLLSGIITVFAGNKRSNELNIAMSDMQENVRFALNTITSDVRMAGHQGCADLNGGSVNIIANNVPISDTSRGLLTSAIYASKIVASNNWVPMPPYGTPPTGFSVPTENLAAAGTHALFVQFGRPGARRLRAQMSDGTRPSTSGALQLNGEIDGLSAGDLAIASDCLGGELFRVTQVSVDSDNNMDIGHDGSSNSSGAFETAYGSSQTINQTRITRFDSNAYYIGDTGLENSNGDSILALYQQSLPYNNSNNPPIELVQGVENLRVSFGVRTSSGALRYISPEDSDFSAKFDPADVRSVRIGLLMASYDPITQQDNETTYVLAGQSIASAATSTSGATHAADKRFRLAFNTTVKIRNLRDHNQ